MDKSTVSRQTEASNLFSSAQGILQRKCACGNQTPGGGKCTECGKKKRSLQRKLTIGASNDPLEREADRVADQVMAAQASSAVSDTPLRIQRYAGQATEHVGSVPASVDSVLTGSGRPLEPALRQDMEQRFGHDFSQVRVHSGAAAERSAREVNAKAYTVGQDIVFGAGQLAPGTHGGRRLLAHELTHVVQQNQFSALKSGLIQRVGFFESITRFFGGGTFSDDELSLYIDTLEGTGQIEGNNDSDNKARAVVSKNMHSNQPLHIRILLIEEMFSGFTGDDDEQAILTILEDANASDLERIVDEIGSEEFIDNFHGDELDRLYRLLARQSRGRRQPVSTSWYVSYTTHGAEDLRPDREEMSIDQFNVYPESEPAAITVVGNTGSVGVSGMPTQVASGVEHPRDVMGRGFIDFNLGGRRMPGPLRGEYGPVTRDQNQVTAHIDVRFGSRHVSNEETSTTTSTETGTETERGTRVVTGAETTRERRRGATGSVSRTGEAVRREERGRALETENTTARSTERGASRTTETTISLAGTLSASLQGNAQLSAGAEIGGELLGSLLLLAGPEGAALYGMLSALDALEGTSLTLGLSNGLGFTLTGELRGEVARRWSETYSRLERTEGSTTRRRGATAAEEREVRRGGESQVSATEEDVRRRTESANRERSQAQTELERRRQEESRRESRLRFRPVPEEANVRFTVR